MGILCNISLRIDTLSIISIPYNSGIDTYQYRKLGIFPKPAAVNTGCLGNISYNRHNPEILMKIHLNQEAYT
jgi:hypothetical protein